MLENLIIQYEAKYRDKDLIQLRLLLEDKLKGESSIDLQDSSLTESEEDDNYQDDLQSENLPKNKKIKLSKDLKETCIAIRKAKGVKMSTRQIQINQEIPEFNQHIRARMKKKWI